MLVENQQTSTRWNQANRKWYVSRGYEYTKPGDTFEVKVEDLMPYSDSKVIVLCDYCGAEYITPYSAYNTGRKSIQKDCCPKCVGLKGSEARLFREAQKRIDAAAEMCDHNGYELLTSTDEYTGVKMIAKFICPKHGVQEMILDNIIHGHRCIRCSYEERGRGLTHSKQYISDKIAEVNGNVLLNPDEYKGSLVRNLRIKCSCGREFTTSFTNYMRANKNRCSVCAHTDSVAETKIGDFLKRRNIKYIPEMRFPDCRDKKPLPFDFYLVDENLIIEYDGKHHFLPIRGERHFEMIQRHDRMKDEYCEEKGIAILRIPYWETKNMLDIIEEKLSA